VDARAVVDEVGVDAPALLGELDAAGLGDAEVRALADRLRAQLVRIHPQRVIRRIAHVSVTLRGRLDVGPDAAEPQQVDARFEDRTDEARRVERLVRDAQRIAYLGAQGNRFLGA